MSVINGVRMRSLIPQIVRFPKMYAGKTRLGMPG